MKRVWLLEGSAGEELLDDRAWTHGLGVFETLLALRGRLVRPDLHFSRLRNGCQRLSIRPPDVAAVEAALSEALAGVDRARVRVMRTAGRGGLRDLAGEDARTVLSIAPATPVPETVEVVSAPWPIAHRSPLAGIKCTSYAMNLVALDHARKAGADESIFANTDGNLCEAATANVFLVHGTSVVTPSLDSGCLPGTARSRVLRLAETSGLQAEERVVSMTEVREADECFLTSATRGVVRVARWDDWRGSKRSVSERLRQAFEKSCRDD